MKKPGEEGYILVAVMFMLAILILSMAVAVPRVKEDIQRDRELETMHRGKQYARAIKLYYKKFQAYPPNIDALVMTNQIRFLRKKYTDPMTGKADWKPIMFGQNKAPLAMGFFGQPLGGAAASLAPTGPSGGNGIQGTGSSFGSSSTGSSFGSGSSFGNSGSSFSNGSTFSSGGTSSGSIFGQDNGGQNSGSSGTTGQNGSTGSSTFGSSGSLSSTQTFGGGGIIGFEPASDKQSMLFYKKKNHYNEWEFTYSPIADQMMSSGNLGGVGTPASGLNGTGSQNGLGGGSTGLGGTGTGINAPTAPSPTTPQQ